MNSKLLVLLFFGVFIGAYAQQEITWKDLANVKFSTKYVESEDGDVLIPVFGDAIKKIEGKEISVTGYFLNLDASTKSFMLSKSPMSACFFCGAGGPETVIEIHFAKKEEQYKTDKIITITGVLKLNQTDINHCNYILEKARGTSFD
ncbi:hypothetical protein NBRC110019_09380 [Neptunitalea chrysea]|uniref:DUF3299 domain-containing protein n=1 Tax=Neptunitalea chrysea TaxID=1647581 RepID=A0A9W6B5Y9_9FLAO|nr:hypothetical protein [Neptunitalea chrysea]GLB51899.1 hypothetical protein NBRC110019_09380 [Neptunitalea chrysea]